MRSAAAMSGAAGSAASASAAALSARLVCTKNLKRKDAASAERYSACPPGAPSGTRSSAASAAPPASKVPSDQTRPTIAAAARSAITHVGASPPKASAASAHTQPSALGSKRARSVAVTIEMSSSRRRACL